MPSLGGRGSLGILQEHQANQPEVIDGTNRGVEHPDHGQDGERRVELETGLDRRLPDRERAREEGEFSPEPGERRNARHAEQKQRHQAGDERPRSSEAGQIVNVLDFAMRPAQVDQGREEPDARQRIDQQVQQGGLHAIGQAPLGGGQVPLLPEGDREPHQQVAGMSRA